MLSQAAQASPSDCYGGPAPTKAADPSGSAATLPLAAFLSRAFQEAEDAAIWVRAWSGVGFTDDIPNAGDILPFTLGNHGIHVERRSDRSLMGRFNKAQHGGCRAVPLQCQTGAKTKCSFTACGYSRDRQPVAAADPDRDRILDQYLGLRPERLLPVATGSWGPLVVACLDPAAAHRSWPRWEEVASNGSIPQAELAATWVEWDANWKHVAAAFQSSPEDVFFDGGDYAFATSPAGLTTTLVFPNIVVLAKEESACVAVLQPTALDRTLCRIRTYAAGRMANDHWVGILRDVRARAETRQSGSRAVNLGAPGQPRSSLAPNSMGGWFEAKVARAIAVLHSTVATTPLYQTNDKGLW